VLVLAIALFIGYAALHASKSQRPLAYGLSGLFLAFSGWFLLEVCFVKARVSKAHLHLWSPWRGRRVIPWSAITGYAYSPANSWHVLFTEGFGTVRLSTLLSGVDQVAEHLAQFSENGG
jgi:hypothetical protein